MTELARLSLDRNLARASAARQTAVAVAGVVGMGPEDAADLELAVGEAVGNALAYGDLPHVQVRFATDGASLFVEILGNRRRFTTKDDGMPEIDAERGRGTALMLRLMDAISYRPTPEGLAVLLEKRLKNPPIG
jgi:anti-sigma regulatory factor (Ser/Thr protein kinase)